MKQKSIDKNAVRKTIRITWDFNPSERIVISKKNYRRNENKKIDMADEFVIEQM